MSKRIYLDYAAAAPLDPRVKAEMDRVEKLWANASSLHEEGRAARAVIDEARAKMAETLGVQTDELVFTSGATEANVLALRGIVDFAKAAGERPHLVVSKIEHPSVKETAEQLEKTGVEVTWLNVDARGLVDVDELSRTIKENTVLVSVIYANHELGVVQDLAGLAQAIKVKNPKTLFHTDAAQALGWLGADLKQLNIDLLTGSAYKLYGPKGVGFLYVRKNVKLSPLFSGFQEWGKRAGTEPTALIAGLAKALEISAAWPVPRVREMRDNLISEFLKNVDGAICNTWPEQSVPHIAHFSLAGVESQLLTIALDRAGLAASPGSACSSGAVQISHIVQAIGIDLQKYPGSLRLSLGIDTQEREVAEAVNILKNVIRELRKNSA